MFIALVQVAFGGLCFALTLAGCVSTTLELTPDHPAHAGNGGPPLLLSSLTSSEGAEAPGVASAPQDHAHAHGAHHHPRAARERSASDSIDAAGAEDGPAASWTCPMHPEVVRDEPGRCPTCGMKLVERQEPPMPGDEK